MKYTILHISDLHKSPEMSYEYLLQSLERDMNSYTRNEGIEKPSFIVVSGDIIQGAESESEIKRQYEEVENFLHKICVLFLNGDRSRMIMVPGNHDINRTRSIESMQPNYDPDEIDDLRTNYFKGSSIVRWSWKSFKFYKIVNHQLYDSRFELFIEFYNRFYSGIRQYPEDPVKEAFVVRNDNFKVSFACFNSCHQLDHLCFAGSIPEEAIISVGEDLNKSYNSGYLNIAVWHHHYYGSPLTSNYIDRKFLTFLLEYNIHVGLFGHQHYSQIAEEFSDLQLYKDEELQRLLLISSGTLFGGNKELEAGKHRQYNIIEVEQYNGEATISVNIREDKNPNKKSLCPIWHCLALNNPSNKIIRKVKLLKLSEEKLLLEIDKQVHTDNNYISACEKVQELNLDDNRKELIWLNYLRKVDDYDYVYKALSRVDSIERAMLKILAAINLGDPLKKQEILKDQFIVNSKDTNVLEILKSL